MSLKKDDASEYCFSLPMRRDGPLRIEVKKNCLFQSLLFDLAGMNIKRKKT